LARFSRWFGHYRNHGRGFKIPLFVMLWGAPKSSPEQVPTGVVTCDGTTLSRSLPPSFGKFAKRGTAIPPGPRNPSLISKTDAFPLHSECARDALVQHS
jgi:hypothetical protein